MRILSGGNVGIGTTSPTAVGGFTTLAINGSVGSILDLKSNGTTGLFLFTNATSTVFSEQRSAFMSFETAATERMRITSGGSVTIGTTSFVSYTGYNVLTVGGNTNGGVLAIRNNGGYGINLSATGNKATIDAIDDTAAMAFTTASTERMRITSGGKIQINGTLGIGGVVQVFNDSATGINIMNSSNAGGLMAFQNVNAVQIGSISTNNSSTSYNTTSDYRLKEDLKEIKGLEKLCAIKVYDFKWKGNDERMDGVIAHELAEILPYAVVGKKDGEQMQGVDYSKLVPILVKAIQELKAEIDELKNK
jgi:hypothetical protein